MNTKNDEFLLRLPLSTAPNQGPIEQMYLEIVGFPCFQPVCIHFG